MAPEIDDATDVDEESAPVLLELVGSIAVPSGKILVPRCGSGHDVFSLASPESVVTGLDPRPEAAAKFEALRAERGIPRSFVRFVAGEPFTWASDGPFDLVWDAAFARRVAPADRPRWAARAAELVAPGGELWILLYPTSRATALPALDPRDLDASLLATSFDRVALAPVARSHAHRQGLEWLGRWRRR